MLLAGLKLKNFKINKYIQKTKKEVHYNNLAITKEDIINNIIETDPSSDLKRLLN